MPTRSGRSRPTLEQVAAHAGVSRATVSRVVNGSTAVASELVALVNRSVAELGYIPNAAARALVTDRTDVVALIASEPDHRVFGDPFFSAIVRGVSQELMAAQTHLMLLMAQSPADLAHIERYLLSGHVDGALLVSMHGHDLLPATLARAGLPLVVGGRPLQATTAVPYVDNDNLDGARRATEHLAALGRARIATVTGPPDMSAGVDRLAGFTAALGDRFRPELVEHGDFTQGGGADATARLLARAPDLDGLFVANDLMAFGALAALRRAGRRVPGDVAVIGFDDIELAQLSEPPLTTVRQHTVEQGRAMAALLLRLLGRVRPEAGPGAEAVLLPVELILRGSA
jgi:DNA-binding LacI/PurR family transcriptional regulator